VRAVLRFGFVWALVGSLATVLSPGCSLGQGTGCVAGTLDVPNCWSGGFDLHPDFFAATPTNSAALELRVQNGQDYESFSDGLVVLIDDLGQVRGDPLPDGTARPSLLNLPLVVGLPAGVTPPGVPVEAIANQSVVHATLYLERTCRTQNVALYALDAVTLQPDGSCNPPLQGVLPCGTPAIFSVASGADAGADASASADASVAVDASANVDAGGNGGVAVDAGASEGDGGLLVCGMANPSWPGNVATSTMTFDSLFDGNAGESNAQKRLTEASFDLYLADPREVCPGGVGPPPPCRSHLQGSFRFYFQRGRPAQPFP
jgi:hypothetical protein